MAIDGGDKALLVIFAGLGAGTVCLIGTGLAMGGGAKNIGYNINDAVSGFDPIGDAVNNPGNTYQQPQTQNFVLPTATMTDLPRPDQSTHVEQVVEATREGMLPIKDAIATYRPDLLDNVQPSGQTVQQQVVQPQQSFQSSGTCSSLDRIGMNYEESTSHTLQDAVETAFNKGYDTYAERVLAEVRNMWRHALNQLVYNGEKKFYPTAHSDNLPDLDKVSQSELNQMKNLACNSNNCSDPQFMTLDDVLKIPTFKNYICNTPVSESRDDYYATLIKQIGSNIGDFIDKTKEFASTYLDINKDSHVSGLEAGFGVIGTSLTALTIIALAKQTYDTAHLIYYGKGWQSKLQKTYNSIFRKKHLGIQPA